MRKLARCFLITGEVSSNGLNRMWRRRIFPGAIGRIGPISRISHKATKCGRKRVGILLEGEVGREEDGVEDDERNGGN